MNYWHIILSISSLLLFLYGVRKFRIIGANKLLFLFLICLCIAYLLYSLFYIVAYYFTGEGINYAVLYHAKYGLEGAGFYEYKYLVSFIILVSGISICLVYFFLYKRSDKKLSKSHANYFFPVILVILAGCIHPATIDLYGLSEKQEGEPFWKYYKKPRVMNVIDKPKNLILIYAESLERTYFDQNIFPDLTKNLRKLEESSISFTNIGQYPQTGWTIAGMVASQCGIPLIAPSHGNSMAGMDTFLAGATCMGDLLTQNGYHLVYLGGASLDFAGKGKFYQSHGFDEILGRDELVPSLKEKSYKNSWGLYDDSLFDIAFKKYEYLSSQKEPFGIFLLTLDTHDWKNNFSKSCKGSVYGNGKNGMLNAVSCSDMLISHFIQRVKRSPYYTNTVIALVSDHLAMRNSASRMLKKMKDKRKNLFFIIEPQIKSALKVDKKGTALDIGPTLLGVLGFESHLGLGRDLLKEKPSIITEIKNIRTSLNGWKNQIVKFWSFPKVNENIAINGKNKTITIDGRTFRTPVLVEYDKKLQTKLRFQLYNNASHHKTLLEHLGELKLDDPFLLVDECKNLSKKWKNLKGHGLCYVSGKRGSNKIIKEMAKDKTIWTANQLKMIASLPVNIVNVD